MKYLILTPVRFMAGKYELLEFETATEAGKFIAQNGLGESIVAKRMDVDVDICEMRPAASDDF